MELLGYISIPIILLYAIVVESLSMQWFKMPKYNASKNPSETKRTQISILIPFRNEAHNLPNILSDLQAQSYPINSYEVLFINDESEDDSARVLEKLLAKKPANYKILSSKGGKKRAIERGLNQATGDFVISLDADVRFGPMLIHCYDSYYQEHKAKLIAGPVQFTTSSQLYSKLFSLEFMSLIASGAAAISLGKPMMLNAANMGFERSIALEFQKEVYHSALASGDDQFLMEAIEQKYGAESIHFMKSQQAIVSTAPPQNLIAFIHQRLRWASKTSSSSSKFSQAIALLIFLFNILIIGSLIYSIVQQSAWIFLGLYAVKFIVDLPLLFSASLFFRQERLMVYYPVVQLLYPWYVVIVGVWSQVGSYSWKGRRVK